MPLIIPAAPTPPNLSNPATFENQCSAFLAWFASVAGSMSGSALLMTDIMGTVSQSGGVPTGAIMEHGSNANGQYWRFAANLQVCILREAKTYTTTASESVFRDTATAGVWTYPIAFPASPWFATFEANGPSAWASPGFSTATQMDARTVFSSVAASAVNITTTSIALGRWY